MTFRVVIPARYASTRLPGKPLALAGGRTVIEHVCMRASESGAASVAVATDDERIAALVRGLGVNAVLTSPDHASGTDRIAEACDLLGYGADEIVVNVQGDEPRMPGAVIRQVGAALAADADAEIATACRPLLDGYQYRDPNVVKVICDALGRALYFSRAPIPWDRDQPQAPRLAHVRRHLGIYAYRVRWLRTVARLAPSQAEQMEQLEQLRALHHGARIRVVEACAEVGVGIDTAEDLAAFRRERGE
ncbi:MAG: 3-deoxy-manno-octulosonate cytidylyltransferase [Gammaproteobacteria bacterium]